MTVEATNENTNENEELNKSIDSLIDELFVDEDPEAQAVSGDDIEKADMIKDQKPQEETADEAMKKVPGYQKDEYRNAGRPKQISDVPQKDKDGRRGSEYDDSITEEKSNKDGKNPEQSQTQPPKFMRKAFTEEEYDEYQDLKRAKQDSEDSERLEKAKKEQSDLIKSAVTEAVEGFKSQNNDLQKKIENQGELIKSMANKPQRARAISNISALEKSSSPDGQPQAMDKKDLLDIGEELYKSGKLTVDHVIELENTGYIFEDEARRVFEAEVKRRA